ncbi:MAG: hypothetical protein O3C40_32835 [Planctomycetota bacterium]|nr:hypothetical protein [Planctomycetota bacterium]
MTQRSLSAGLTIVGLAAALTHSAWSAPRNDRETRSTQHPIFRDGFDNGLAAPWGADRYRPDLPIWWNSSNCGSTATMDRAIKRSGTASLHIVNLSPRAAHVYGTTQRPIPVEPGRKYRISLWAKARNLASRGGVSIVLDTSWKARPIELLPGTYDWTYYTREFDSSADTLPLRILSEDRGEVWIDELAIAPVVPEGPTKLTEAERDALLANVGRGLAGFRQAAVRDYQLALEQYASSDVRRQFERLDKHLWPVSEPRVAWSFFVSMSVITVAENASEQPIAAFYNPWSDVFLITVWEATGDSAQIIDAEMLMGDWVRTGGKFSRTPVPLWLRGETFRPAAVATAVVESVDAFRSKFAGADAADWRTKLPRLDDDSVVVDLNHKGVALLTMNAMIRVNDFWKPRLDEPAELAVLRSRTTTVLRAAMAGELAKVLEEADETLPVTRELLLKTEPDVFRQLTVAATVVGAREGIVFLVSSDERGF